MTTIISQVAIDACLANPGKIIDKQSSSISLRQVRGACVFIMPKLRFDVGCGC